MRGSILAKFPISKRRPEKGSIREPQSTHLQSFLGMGRLFVLYTSDPSSLIRRCLRSFSGRVIPPQRGQDALSYTAWSASIRGVRRSSC